MAVNLFLFILTRGHKSKNLTLMSITRSDRRGNFQEEISDRGVGDLGMDLLQVGAWTAKTIVNIKT